MERMWRKVNQGLISKPSSSGKVRSISSRHVDTIASSSTIGFGAGAISGSGGAGTIASSSIHSSRETYRSSNLKNATSTNTITTINSTMIHTTTDRDNINQRRSHRVTTAVPNLGGGVSIHTGGGGGVSSTGRGGGDGGGDLTTTSTESRRKRRRKSKPRHCKNNSLRLNASQNVELVATKEQSLRERAVAKFKLLNFNINWNIHLTNCRPCRSTSNSNIITRRLYRNRHIDENELYRSNSFKFERFKRKDLKEESYTLPRPISVCDDYSLPLDFVRRTESSIVLSCKSFSKQQQQLPQPIPSTNTLNPTIESVEPDHIINIASSIDQTSHHSILPSVKSFEILSEQQSNRNSVEINNRQSGSDSSLPCSSEEEDDGQKSNQSYGNSPESIIEDLAIKCPNENASPYYYSDLLTSNKKNHTLHSNNSSYELQAASVVSSENLTVNNNNNNNNNNNINNNYQQQQQLQHQQQYPPQKAIRYKQNSKTLDLSNQHHQQQQLHHQEENQHQQQQHHRKIYSQRRYSVYEEGVHIIKCETPSTTSTSDDSNCTECQKRRQNNSKLYRNVPLSLYDTKCEQMPPHRLLDVASCVCATTSGGGGGGGGGGGNSGGLNANSVLNDSLSTKKNRNSLSGCRITSGDCNEEDDDDNFNEMFCPRSIFYVHEPNEHSCVDCSPLQTKQNQQQQQSYERNEQHHRRKPKNDGASTSSRLSESTKINPSGFLYETAFDCKIISHSEDDVDELSRINSLELLTDAISTGLIIDETSDNNTKSIIGKNNHRSKSKFKLFHKNSIENVDFQSDGSSPQRHQQQKQQQQQQLSKSDRNNDSDNSQRETIVSSSINLTHATGPSSSSITALQNIENQSIITPPLTAPLPAKFPYKHENNISRNKVFHKTITSDDHQLNPDHHHHHHSSSGGGGAVGGIGSSSLDNANMGMGIVGGAGSVIGSGIGGMEKLKKHHRPHTLSIGPSKSLNLTKPKLPHLIKNKRIYLYNHQRIKNCSSTESMTTSSSGGSMESLRSSGSEGNRSTTSYESRHSTSLSSHSSDSGSRRVIYPIRTTAQIHQKLHILSPISDKSSLEQTCELFDAVLVNNKVMAAAAIPTTSTGAAATATSMSLPLAMSSSSGDVSASTAQAAVASGSGSQAQKCNNKKLFLQNKALLLLGNEEIQGSDSGISLHSRDDTTATTTTTSATIKGGSGIGGSGSGFASVNRQKFDIQNSSGFSLPDNSLNNMPFDIPKLVRRKQLMDQQKLQCASDTSVDLGDLPFDMPKLKRRLRLSVVGNSSTMVPTTTTTSNNMSTDQQSLPATFLKPQIGLAAESSGISHASSSQSFRDDKQISGMFKKNLTLHFNPSPKNEPNLKLDISTQNKGLHLNLGGISSFVDIINIDIALERQTWYHGAITRIEAENILRPLAEGCFLVRNCESSRQDYSLSLKSAKGFMHMRIQQNDVGKFILGQFSQPFDSISEIIRHYCLNRLPVRGAEHMCLLEPVAAQLL